MEIPFSLHGRAGTVAVEIRRNDDPAALGCTVHARDFPVCTAAVDYAGEGYNALLGWVQLVSSTDGESGEAGFDPDPMSIYQDLATPYAFFGIRPVLFDAPSRSRRGDLRWLAHSFLCFSPTLPRPVLEVRAVLGFSWGFDIRAGQVHLRPVGFLRAASWNGHRERLLNAYPTWQFAPGFSAGDPAT
jgi:hypothetical protein